MTITQEQLHKYAETQIQPLADALLEHSKSRGAPACDFFLACMYIAAYALDQSKDCFAEKDKDMVEVTIKNYNTMMSAIATDEVGRALERKV